ncbi:MAG: PaREP1 family protein, partial [Vulcanisaeta sp.]
AVMEISRRLGRWFRQSWDTANYLHVWGFHEAKLNAEDINDRLPDIEKMVQKAQRVLGSEGKGLNSSSNNVSNEAPKNQG